MPKNKILALAVATLVTLPSAGAVMAQTVLEFDLVNLRDVEDDPTMNTAGTYALSSFPGGFSYGVAAGTIVLEFQGDGTTIENGTVSVVGGDIFNTTNAGLPGLIQVDAEVTSSFIEGNNDDVGTLMNWDGSTGTIEWIEVLREWPDNIWPGEGETPDDPGPPEEVPDSLGLKVINNGTLDCAGSLCGQLGTPPDGRTRQFVDHAAGWAEPLMDTTISYSAGGDALEERVSAAPLFGLDVPQSILAYQPDGKPAQELALEGEAVPEPGRVVTTVAALSALLVLRRLRPSV